MKRFYDKIVLNNKTACHEWIGAKDRAGYGSIRINKKSLGAHRVGWELRHGTIPKNMRVLHKCDNPKCVNPDHLFLGSQMDNIRDMIKKRRARFFNGEDLPQSKLTSDDVNLIRSSTEPTNRLAKTLGVSYHSIWHVRMGHTWKHV